MRYELWVVEHGDWRLYYGHRTRRDAEKMLYDTCERYTRWLLFDNHTLREVVVSHPPERMTLPPKLRQRFPRESLHKLYARYKAALANAA